MRNSLNENLFDFKKNYETHFSSLVSFACRFVPPQVANDIVQDIFVAVWEQDIEYNSDTIRSYLFTAVKNKCLNFIRQQSTEEKYIDHVRNKNYILELQYYDSVEKLIIDNENLALIHQQIDLLPKKRQIIFKLAYLEEKKSAEIAQKLNISQRTVEHHLYLSIRVIREKIKKDKK